MDEVRLGLGLDSTHLLGEAGAHAGCLKGAAVRGASRQRDLPEVLNIDLLESMAERKLFDEASVRRTAGKASQCRRNCERWHIPDSNEAEVMSQRR